jgi:hypothetical protein
MGVIHECGGKMYLMQVSHHRFASDKQLEH